MTENHPVNQENEFSFAGNKWGENYKDGSPEGGFSLANASLKFKALDGALTAKGGLTQLYVPGVIGVNWSYQPGTYRGGQIEGNFGGLYLTYAIADEYKSPGTKRPRSSPVPRHGWIRLPMKTSSTTSRCRRPLHLRERHRHHRFLR